MLLLWCIDNFVSAKVSVRTSSEKRPIQEELDWLGLAVQRDLYESLLEGLKSSTAA